MLLSWQDGVGHSSGYRGNTAAVLSVREEERWGPIFTLCDRKSLIQAQVEGGICKSRSLFISMSGVIVLKVEL